MIYAVYPILNIIVWLTALVCLVGIVGIVSILIYATLSKESSIAKRDYLRKKRIIFLKLIVGSLIIIAIIVAIRPFFPHIGYMITN